MTSKTVTVPAINCGHCTNTIEMEVGELAGVSTVTADVESKKVTVEWSDPADWAQIEALMQEIDFPPEN
jgi:copper chaperone CopZ